VFVKYFARREQPIPNGVHPQWLIVDGPVMKIGAGHSGGQW